MQKCLLRRRRYLLLGTPATAKKLGFEPNPELFHGGWAAKAEPENNCSDHDHVQKYNEDAYNDHFNLFKPSSRCCSTRLLSPATTGALRKIFCGTNAAG
jgi:hypothetical protein